jgi:hypothetical protein
MRRHALENRSYLGEFEAEFKKALARESGAQGVLFFEKNEGRKCRDTVPLIAYLSNFEMNKESVLKMKGESDLCSVSHALHVSKQLAVSR